MIPTFTYNDTTVIINHSVPEYDWGQSRDKVDESVITGKRNALTLGDHADVSILVHLYRCTPEEQAAIKAIRGKSGTLATDIGTAEFYCSQIKYDTLAPLDERITCILTFRSINYV